MEELGSVFYIILTIQLCFVGDTLYHLMNDSSMQ